MIDEWALRMEKKVTREKLIMNDEEIKAFRKQWGVIIGSRKESTCPDGEIQVKWKVTEIEKLTNEELCDAMTNGEFAFHGCASDIREAYAIIRKLQNERVASKIM